MYKLEFLETGIEESFYTKVVRSYWFKCHKLDFGQKKYEFKGFFIHTYWRAKIESSGQHPIDPTSDSIWAL